MALTTKQRAFVEEYLRCWNGAAAARRAGYKRPRQSAHENLTKPYIAELIEQRIREKAMAANEILAHVADVARADTIGHLIGKAGIIDLEEARKKGLTRFIKKLKWTERGPEIEAYSRMEALELLGKHSQLWDDKGRDFDITLRVRYEDE